MVRRIGSGRERAWRRETGAGEVKIAVVGGGAWGTALADLLARKGGVESVTLWAREPEVVDSINREHVNHVFLPGATLGPTLRASGDLEGVVREADVVVSAAPSHVVRDVMARASSVLRRGALVVSVSKGLEPERLATPSCVLGEVLPRGAQLAVLSGPSFAQEVYQREPTAVVAAARDHAVAQRVQQVFSCGYFRVYSATDVTGVELGGALKNVIALAAGILDGLGMGHNTRAALLTRGLAEITRLGTALGADPATVPGLAGMGDLQAAGRNPPGAGLRGESVPFLDPGQEPLGEPGVPAPRDRAHHAGEAPAVHREVHDRGGAPEDRAVPPLGGAEARGAPRARHADGEGPAGRAQGGARRARGDRAVQCRRALRAAARAPSSFPPSRAPRPSPTSSPPRAARCPTRRSTWWTTARRTGPPAPPAPPGRACCRTRATGGRGRRWRRASRARWRTGRGGPG